MERLGWPTPKSSTLSPVYCIFVSLLLLAEWLAVCSKKITINQPIFMRITTAPLWIIALFIAVSALIGCSHSAPAELHQGVWRGIISLQGQDLPFNFSVVGDSVGYRVYLKNAQENLLLDEVKVNGDSVTFQMHIFDAQLKARLWDDSLQGYFIKNSQADYRLPFHAVYDKSYRFEEAQGTADATGKWRVTFSNDSDTTQAIGLFQQMGTVVTGTFLTATGDYRYLEGNMNGDTLQLSAFDGNHAFLFKAKVAGDTLQGHFWSGKSWHQQWLGVRDDTVTLPDPTNVTHLKEGYEKVSFSFPDLTGHPISPEDEKYHNKVVILQIAGTWCPNCMDETRFLEPWYEKHKDKGVEIIGLFYEAKPDVDYARARVQKMVDKLGIGYDVVIAGTSDKQAAAKTLPMLDKIASFPTTIFIGRDGKVKEIHSGFSGPGTGIYYEQFIQHFNDTVTKLLEEDTTTPAG